MKRILVADDSVTIQKVIALTFADEPFEVKSVGTGAEAIEFMKSYTPDIVLADVIMPQMNGYELCRAVKQQEGTSHIPVLLLAGTFEAFDEGEAKSVGADDFITKPFESGELIEKVKVLLGEGSALAAAQNQAKAPAVAAVPEPAPPAPPTAVEPTPFVAAAPTPFDVGGQEPDIWDILSDTSDEAQTAATEPPIGGSDAGVPGFGPIEDAGVVDVGSFDVGLDRPEPPPAPVPPPVIAIPEPPVPEPPPELTMAAAAPPQAPMPPESVALPEPAPPEPAPPQAAPIVVEPPAMPGKEAVEKSRVEDREKDFFGFESGAVEEVSGADILSEAIEEVTFDMDEVFPAGPGASPEASFVVPEPASYQPQAPGETVAPYTMAPPPPPPPQEPALVAEPVAPAPPEPAFDVAEMSFEPAPEPPAPPAPGLQVADVPEPVSIPVPPSELSATAAEGAGSIDDAAIRKIIEAKVEKIAWEIVPELAEVFIREALEKIKGGS